MTRKKAILLKKDLGKRLIIHSIPRAEIIVKAMNIGLLRKGWMPTPAMAEGIGGPNNQNSTIIMAIGEIFGNLKIPRISSGRNANGRIPCCQGLVIGFGSREVNNDPKEYVSK